MLTHSLLAALALAPAGAVTVTLDRVTVEAIKVAGDPFGKRDARVEAIHRLGRLGTDRAFDFLAEHLDAAMIRPGIRSSSESQNFWEVMPYYMALTHTGWERERYDPRAAAAVLRALDKPRTRDDLVFVCNALITLTTKAPDPDVIQVGPALKLVKQELARNPKGDLKDTLTRLAEMLSTGRW